MYWKNRPNNLDDWLSWELTFEWVKGNNKLQIKKIKTSKEDFDNYEEGNWDNFFETAEDLKIREYVNTNEPMNFFNNCLLVYNKGNKHDNTPAYYSFVNPNNLKISGRDKTLFPNLIEYCITPEQRMRSKQRIKRERKREDLQNKFLKWYEQDKLYFGDVYSKKIIEEFIGKGRTISEF